MNTTTELKPGTILVDADADRDVWMTERGLGATASQAHAIAKGGRASWASILEDKLNGSTFRGNAHTQRGHVREEILMDFAATIADVEPNSALWASAENPLLRATPDGVGTRREDGEPCNVEVKSHAFGWDSVKIPAEHLSQMMFAMYVRGVRWCLYAFEVLGEDGQPTLNDPTHIWVEYDEEHVAWLVAKAEEFIAWREDGCPDVDDLDPATAALLAEWVAAKAAVDGATKAEKALNAKLKKATLARPYAQRFGAVLMGDTGGVQVTVAESVRLDEYALAAGDAEAYEDLVARRAAAAEVTAELAKTETFYKALYPKTTRSHSMRLQKREEVSA